MFKDHEKHALCDSYIVEFVHDATENYFERGKYGYRNIYIIKFPLFMMKVLSFLLCCFYMIFVLRPNGPSKVLKFHLFCLPMVVTLCLIDLFSYKTPMHRKSVRFKHVLYMLLDALFYVSTLIFM